jgi:hypothetical protein
LGVDVTPQAWLDAATRDAERRALPELKPLLETLSRSMEALRRHEEEHLEERTAADRKPRS